MIKKFSLSVAWVGILVIVAGCSAQDTKIVPSTDLSPPPPSRASEQLVSRVAPAVSVTKSVGNTEGELEGTAVDVSLEDPGGSGEYVFDAKDLTFRVGDVIAFTLSAETEFHTFTVDELGIDESVDASEEIRFSFTFDRAGTYKLVCIPHESLGMIGTITVQ